MKYILPKAVLLGALVLLLGMVHSAKADGLQISCTGATICTAGGVETTPSLNPTFDVSLVGNGSGSENGELWIAVIVPTTSGANFTAPDSSTLWTALGEGTGGSDHSFGSTTGNNPFFASESATGFIVSDFDTGQMLTGSQTSTVIAPGSFAAGTMFVAFTENASDNIAADSPWSESLLLTGTTTGGTTTGGTTTGGTTTGGTTGGTTGSPVPEPGTLMLLGSGLSMAGILKRRFLFGSVK